MKTKYILAGLMVMSAPAFADDAAPVKEPVKEYVCLRHSEVDGWGARDDHSMIVNDRFGRKYLLSLQGICHDINWAWGVGFRPLGSVVNMGTCVDRGDHVVMRGGGVDSVHNDTCWVTKVQRYTPEMQQADKLAKESHQPLAAY